MIRYLQKLKARKGFTLVEMIVVIAIISVLAAILIPTLGHYVTMAQVTSANASASLLRKNLEYFLFELSMNGKGMKLSTDKSVQIFFMCKNGQWKAKAEVKPNGSADSAFQDANNWWRNSQNFVLTDSVTKNDPNHLLAMTRVVADTLADVKTAFIGAFFTKNMCDGVIYIKNCDLEWPTTNSGVRPCILNDPSNRERPGMTEFWPYRGKWPASADSRIWDGVAGVDRDGYIVGTNPAIDFVQ